MKSINQTKIIVQFSLKEAIDFNETYLELSQDLYEGENEILSKIYKVLPSTENIKKLI